MVSFSEYASGQSSAATIEARDILSTFPRGRIGLKLPQDPHAAELVIRQYRDIVGHFLFK